MLDDIRKLQKDLSKLEINLKKIRARQVTHSAIKNDCKELVDFYFRYIREKLIDKTKDNQVISSSDSLLQTLLSLTHKNTSTIIYISTLHKIKSVLLELEKVALVSNTSFIPNNHSDDQDKVILATLKKLIPSAALSYEQALIDLKNEARLSWRGPATDLRESLRECLDYLAPDSEVSTQAGFKLEPGTNGPTMKQKVKYILRKRLLSKDKLKTTEEAANLIDELVGGFVRSVYTRASISTHTTTDITEVKRIQGYVKIVFSEILEIN